jgi:hypothetical protein
MLDSRSIADARLLAQDMMTIYYATSEEVPRGKIMQAPPSDHAPGWFFLHPDDVEVFRGAAREAGREMMPLMERMEQWHRLAYPTPSDENEASDGDK